MDYMFEILVPETTCRLIREDYDNNITLENARTIMIDSIEFGKYLHSYDNDKLIILICK